MPIERIDVYKNLDSGETKVYPKTVADAVYMDETEEQNIKEYVDNAISEVGGGDYLPLSGGTLTGPISINNSSGTKLFSFGNGSSSYIDVYLQDGFAPQTTLLNFSPVAMTGRYNTGFILGSAKVVSDSNKLRIVSNYSVDDDKWNYNPIYGATPDSSSESNQLTTKEYVDDTIYNNNGVLSQKGTSDEVIIDRLKFSPSVTPDMDSQAASIHYNSADNDFEFRKAGTTTSLAPIDVGEPVFLSHAATKMYVDNMVESNILTGTTSTINNLKVNYITSALVFKNQYLNVFTGSITATSDVTGVYSINFGNQLHPACYKPQHNLYMQVPIIVAIDDDSGSGIETEGGSFLIILDTDGNLWVKTTRYYTYCSPVCFSFTWAVRKTS